MGVVRRSAPDLEVAGRVIEREIRPAGHPGGGLDIVDPQADHVSGPVNDFDPLTLFALQDEHWNILLEIRSKTNLEMTGTLNMLMQLRDSERKR